jgi:DNA-binding NtrC family response regulator
MQIQKIETLKPINAPQAPLESVSQNVEQPRIKVLVAEKDSPMRDRLYRLLSKDCQVVCVKTVRRAAQLIRRNHFDLVICDQELPSSGGMALLNFVKLQAPETHVVLGMPEFDARIRRQAILRGALECYVKPMSVEAVRFLILHVRLGLRMISDSETEAG